jgi:hypothetical protein
MDPTSRSQSTRFRSSQLVAMLLVIAVAVVAGIAVSFAARSSHPELSKVFAVGAATLLFGSVLGGVVSLLIADFDRRRLQRAAQLDFISNVPIGKVEAKVHRMAEYLTALIGEFEQNYKHISRQQSLYEARMKKAVEQAVSTSNKDSELPKNEPWEAIAALRLVRDFIALPNCTGPASSGVAPNYKRDFLDPLDEASLELRDMLRKELA